ncbi:MAG: hypothetical protein AAGF56_11420, partial [Pseudomonadota bacterium]
LSLLVLGLTLHVALYTNTYELRYDRDRFLHRNWFYQKREYDWDDLRSIRDDNAYFYVIRTHRSGKTYVPKHLTGIEGFLTAVQQNILINENA